MKEKCSIVLEPWFIVALFLITAHQILQKGFGVNISLIDSYLDPLLLMPVLLHLLLWEKRVLFKKGYSYTFTGIQLVLYFFVISTVWEILFPRWNPLFIADINDVICYAFGTMYFALLRNKPYLYSTDSPKNASNHFS